MSLTETAPTAIDSEGGLYSASLLFRSLRNNTFFPENIWEESVVLLQACSEDDALEKANKIGTSCNTSYITADGDLLTWEFFKVERVFQITGPLEQGCELFSRFLRYSEVGSLLTPFEEQESERTPE
jgi:hypothetical protein